MSTVTEPAGTEYKQALEGVVRGQTIELSAPPIFPDGQRVAVELQMLPNDEAGTKCSDGVLRFAKEQHVEEYVPKVLEMTRRIFPAARRLAVLVDDDPEIPNDRHIVFEVEVSGLNVEQAVEAEWRWSGDIFDVCPSTHVCVFRLSLRLVV